MQSLETHISTKSWWSLVCKYSMPDRFVVPCLLSVNLYCFHCITILGPSCLFHVAN